MTSTVAEHAATRRLDTSRPPLRGGVVVFVVVAAAAWAVFQGAPLLGLELSPLGELVEAEPYAWLAAAALAATTGGILVGAGVVKEGPPRETLSRVFESLATLASSYLALTALPLITACGYYAVQTQSLGYGAVDPYPKALNLLLYVNLSLLPIVLWSRRSLGARRYWIALAAVAFPRLLISLTGPRFFVMQALIPIVLWEATYVRKLSVGRVFAVVAAGIAFFFFLAPALRGDEESGFVHAVIGSPVLLVPQFDQLGLLDSPPAGLISCEIVANALGPDLCGLRRYYGIPSEVPARIDQAANYHLRAAVGLDSVGTGGNPLLEAFPRLTLDWNVLWFVAIGALCGVVVRRMHVSTLCCFVMPHVTAKGLFLWRGTISEFFDRLPLIVLVYAALMVLGPRLKRRTC